MEQDKQVKKVSPLYEILASSQNYLVEIEKEKRLALIDAWEENEKAKARTKSVNILSKLSRAYKELCSIEAWESNMKRALELDLKKMEEKLEVEKAEYSKNFKKKIPEIEKIAEAKREKIEKEKEQESSKLEQMSAKLSSTPNAYPPTTKTCGCF